MSRTPLSSSDLMQRVKDAMQANGHNVYDLALRCNVSWLTAQNWLKGRNKPQPRNRKALYSYSYYTVGATKPERKTLARFLNLFSLAK